MPEVEVVSDIPDVREQMRAFKKRWETQLDANYEQMSEEALALGFRIEANYGGSHGFMGGSIRKSRINLEVLL